MGTGPLAPRTLWVLRHAKAGAHGPDDHGRALTGRGRRQAAEVAGFLATAPSAGLALPAVVLCSSADRARQTAELVLDALGPETELVVERSLYHADADEVVDIVRQVHDDAVAVMVVGHNPTLLELALLLLGPRDREGPVRLEAGLPTAALAVLRADIASWGQLAPATGTLLELFVPGRRAGPPRRSSDAG